MKNITVKMPDNMCLITAGDMLVALAEDISISEMMDELPIDGKQGFSVAFSNGFDAYIYRKKSGIYVEVGTIEPPERIEE